MSLQMPMFFCFQSKFLCPSQHCKWVPTNIFLWRNRKNINTFRWKSALSGVMHNRQNEVPIHDLSLGFWGRGYKTDVVLHDCIIKQSTVLWLSKDLTITTLRANWYFSYFSQEMGFDISCKLSQLETICMKCQIPFPEQNKKNISKCCLLKILSRVLSVKIYFYSQNSLKYMCV